MLKHCIRFFTFLYFYIFFMKKYTFFSFFMLFFPQKQIPMHQKFLLIVKNAKALHRIFYFLEFLQKFLFTFLQIDVFSIFTLFDIHFFYTHFSFHSFLFFYFFLFRNSHYTFCII